MKSLHSSVVRGACLALVAASVAVANVAVVETAKAAPTAGDTTKKATDLFLEGRKIYEAGGPFQVALDKFKQSYDLTPSPNSLIYVARCQAKMNNFKEAYKTFQKVIADSDKRIAAGESKYQPTKESAQREILDSQKQIGLVSLTVNSQDPGAVARINGAIIPREEWGKDYPVDAGPQEVTLEVPGASLAQQKITLQKGERQVVSLSAGAAVVSTPTPTPTPGPVKRAKTPFLPIAIAFGGVGVAGAVMFAVGGSMSNSTFSDLQTKCGANGPCKDHSSDDLISSGKTQQTVANIGLVVGAVGLATSATFFILAGTVKGKPIEAQGEPTLALDIAPNWLGMHGSF